MEGGGERVCGLKLSSFFLFFLEQRWCVFFYFYGRHSGSELEHVAYREISTKCSLMNAPLYVCYNRGRGRGAVVWTIVIHTFSMLLLL